MIVVSVDYLFGEQLVLRPTLSPQMYLLLVIASYVVGQVISHLSAVVLEQWLVKRLLGGSTGVLLAGEHGRSPWARLFPQYFHGLKTATAARVMAQAERRGCKLTGDELYDHCYAVVTEASGRAASRLDYLKSQYGFARNIAFGFFCSADDCVRGRGGAAAGESALGHGGDRGIRVHALPIPEILPGVRVGASEAICGASGAFAVLKSSLRQVSREF